MQPHTGIWLRKTIWKGAEGKGLHLSCELHLHLDVFAQHNIACVRVFVYPDAPVCARIPLVGDNVDVWAQIKGRSPKNPPYAS